MTQKQKENATIVTNQLTLTKGDKIIKSNGTIVLPPQNITSIAIPLGGYLKSTKLVEGMYIKKGETIAIVEDPQYIQLQQDYLLTKSKLKFLDIEYARQKEMNASQATSAKTLAQIESEIIANKIMLKAYEEKLKLININANIITEKNITKNIAIQAPNAGYVTKVNANIGKYITPTDVLFEIISPEKMLLSIHIFEKDLKHLSIGQKVYAYTNTNANVKYECTIQYINKSMEQNGTANILCNINQFDKSIIVGTYMNAEIQVPSQNKYVINEDAIVNFEEKNYVFYMNENNSSYQMYEVKIGDNINQNIEILNYSELIDKKIVTQGAYTLLMALKNVDEE